MPRAACERRKAVEPVLHAFECLPTDVSRRPGPLSGIPVGIKDIIATSDMPTTNGSPVYRGHVPTVDAWVVERLRQLGATIFGKTVSTEFAWRIRDDGQPVEPGSHAGRIVVRLRRFRRGGAGAAGARHPDARLDHPTARVQRRCRAKAEFRRHPADRRASLKSVARSRRLFRAARR